MLSGWASFNILSHRTFNLQTAVEALNGSLPLVPGLSYDSATLPAAVCLQALILRSAYVALKTGLKNRAAPAPGLLASRLAQLAALVWLITGSPSGFHGFMVEKVLHPVFSGRFSSTCRPSSSTHINSELVQAGWFWFQFSQQTLPPPGGGKQAVPCWDRWFLLVLALHALHNTSRLAALAVIWDLGPQYDTCERG